MNWSNWIIHGITFLIGVVSCLMFLSYVAYRTDRKDKKLPKNQTQYNSYKSDPVVLAEDKLNLTFDEILTIVKVICDEITLNKYIFLYDLQELNFIKIEEELPKIVNEITDSLSVQMFAQAERYVTRKYFIQMITRNIEIILIQWLQKNKPNVG